MSDTDWHYQTLDQLAGALRAERTTSEALTGHCLDRIECLDGKLGAFRVVDADAAIADAAAADRTRREGQPLGPLHGIPFAVKDLFDVQGHATGAGSHLLADRIAARDATVVRRLRGAGMVLLGKTHTVQFAYGGAGINHDTGTPHNPWHEVPHVPGGSSSGSAVAVAAGMAPMALGSDTGGSVRIPAALCGVTGLKTTVGQVSRAGVYPLSWTLDSVGPLCRSVHDAALVYEQIQGTDRNDATTAGYPRHPVLSSLDGGVRGLRLAFARRVFWDEADAQVEAAVHASGPVLESLGASVTEIDFNEAEAARQLNRRGLIIAAEAWTLNRHWLEEHFDALDPIVAHRMIKGRDVSAEAYLRMSVEMQCIRNTVGQSLEGIDALLVPTTPIPALPVSSLERSIDAYAEHNIAYLRNTAIGNVLNLCGVSVPCGFTADGLPIGLMVYARPFHEHTALRVAHAYQSATDWHRRVPALAWTT